MKKKNSLFLQSLCYYRTFIIFSTYKSIKLFFYLLFNIQLTDLDIVILCKYVYPYEKTKDNSKLHVSKVTYTYLLFTYLIIYT